ncbi:EAL domain-containing protein [Subtercola frigoramans]|uniref:Diguanylate cyclase (GGDEF)-like protein n=1 Tax=Subtercola frigoramans TaxID=120298 RepID=A0ABS2L1H8_9MICO|nr:EAL domain-containing protein [Subtercola frigoramans]MBM7470935.1 diguanylate cyclase (GGDEF)-like protein [Subtercola frigoramans]
MSRTDSLQNDFRSRVVQILAVETSIRYAFFALFVDIQPSWLRLVLGFLSVAAIIVAILIRNRELTSHVPGRILIVAAMIVLAFVGFVITSPELAVIAAFSLLGLAMSAIALDTFRPGMAIGLVGHALALLVLGFRSSTIIAAYLIYIGLAITATFLIVRLRAFLELERDAALQLAHTDPLTGLLNRRGMEIQVPLLDAVAQRDEQLLGCLVLDLDHFKKVNDAFGHRTGDSVLSRTAETIQSTIRAADIAVRTGGEEFAVFSVVRSSTDLALLAERLRSNLASTELKPHVTASIGGAIGRGGSAEEISSLFELADTVLFTAKKAGRNTVRMFDGSLGRPLPASALTADYSRSKASDVSAAIRDRTVFVVYQPIVDLEAERIIGFEALARLTTPDGSNIIPPIVISEARKQGLLDRLTIDIVTDAYLAMEEFLDIEPGAPTLHINIEATQITSPELLEHLETMRMSHPRVQLRLEFTEASISDLNTDAIEQMRSLAQSGISFALDDYGQDHASAAALLRMPLHTVKIDKVFLADETNPRHKIILSSVAHLVSDLQMHTVVEGVETQSGHQTLVDLGITHAQGYLYGRPLTAEDTKARLTDSGLTMWT